MLIPSQVCRRSVSIFILRLHWSCGLWKLNARSSEVSPRRVISRLTTKNSSFVISSTYNLRFLAKISMVYLVVTPGVCLNSGYTLETLKTREMPTITQKVVRSSSAETIKVQSKLSLSRKTSQAARWQKLSMLSNVFTQYQAAD